MVAQWFKKARIKEIKRGNVHGLMMIMCCERPLHFDRSLFRPQPKRSGVRLDPCVSTGNTIITRT